MTDGLEAIDLQILQLLSLRFASSSADAEKHGTGVGVGDEDHRAATLSRIRRKAFELGIPVSLVTDFWDRMLDAEQARLEQVLRRREG
ncbi:chorismate mutase [Novosphingobium sp. B1]|uniref:chorismate mutase n=1 Tax=Novosphingobium sp. B1 TaxID=1938756 RepID=UPI0009D7B926|nr:chorismate mutase [Novosphingobium sp. B1]SMC91132.1 hypothetical protein SAMN06272759_11132 [Novosphingobium sp. B1]